MTNIFNLLKIPIVNNFLIEIGGEICPKVISLCNGAVTDEEIFNNFDDDTKLTKIRSILNKLHYKGIATYERTRDKNSGWYTYTWDLKTNRIVELITQIHNESIEGYETRLENEQNYVYFQCPNNCERMPFEIASEYNFKCPECSSDMQAADNTQLIKDLEQTITDTKTQIEKISEFKNLQPPIRPLIPQETEISNSEETIIAPKETLEQTIPLEEKSIQSEKVTSSILTETILNEKSTAIEEPETQISEPIKKTTSPETIE